MSSIDYAVQQLTTAILDSKEYKEYDEARKKVREFPELKQKMDKFRERNYELQQTGDCSLDAVWKLEEEYKDVLENPCVHEFLMAELAFCRMMQQMNHSVFAAVHFE